MSATQSAINGITTRFVSDSAVSNGLTLDTSAALVRGLFYEKPPDNQPWPNVVFFIDERTADVSGATLVELTIRFRIGVQQKRTPLSYTPAAATTSTPPTAATNQTFGFEDAVGGVEPITDRMKDRFDRYTLPADDSWSFSPLAFVGKQDGPNSNQESFRTLSFRCWGSRALSAPTTETGGPVSGLGTAISGTIATAAGSAGSALAINWPFAFVIQQTQELADVTRRRDLLQRLTHSTPAASAIVQFVPDASGSTPSIPTGWMYALTLTMASGKTYATGTGGTAYFERLDASTSVRGATAAGTYLVRFSAVVSPAFGPPVYGDAL